VSWMNTFKRITCISAMVLLVVSTATPQTTSAPEGLSFKGNPLGIIQLCPDAIVEWIIDGVYSWRKRARPLPVASATFLMALWCRAGLV
jgi:hypothetical protein